MITYIFIGLFTLSLGTLIYYLDKNKKKSKRIGVLEKSLTEKIIKAEQRKGFYDGHFMINSDGENRKYEFRVYVTEEEKYLNGYSKFKLEKVDMKHGFNVSTYPHVIRAATADFVEIQETENVFFLEEDKDVSQIRREKLERILENK